MFLTTPDNFGQSRRKVLWAFLFKNLSSVSGRELEKTQKKQTLEVTHDLNNIDSLRLEDAFLGWIRVYKIYLHRISMIHQIPGFWIVCYLHVYESRGTTYFFVFINDSFSYQNEELEFWRVPAGI